jgi:uncharacterized membrane protein YgdD (TMEM256/DUF423 family)
MRAAVLMAAILGFIGVALGAWSAHGAERLLDAQALAWLHTGVEYQIWHSLALLASGILIALRPGRLVSLAAIFFGLGILLFSGSLYALAFTGNRGFAMLTPFGGTALLIGWALLAIHALTLPRRR